MMTWFEPASDPSGMKKWSKSELLSVEKGLLGTAVGCCRVVASDGDSRRVKLVAVYFVDDSLPNKSKAFATTYRRYLQSFLLGCHVEFKISSKDELSQQQIIRELLLAGGAHAPKQFDF